MRSFRAGRDLRMKGEVRPLANVPRPPPHAGDGRYGNDDERIRFAIVHRRLLKFTLYGLSRVGEPHDYGIRNGAPQLLVYQVGGESQSASSRLGDGSSWATHPTSRCSKTHFPAAATPRYEIT